MGEAGSEAVAVCLGSNRKELGWVCAWLCLTAPASRLPPFQMFEGRRDAFGAQAHAVPSDQGSPCLRAQSWQDGPMHS